MYALNKVMTKKEFAEAFIHVLSEPSSVEYITETSSESLIQLVEKDEKEYDAFITKKILEMTETELNVMSNAFGYDILILD